MNKFDKNNFVLDKVVEVTFYSILCPKCGSANIPVRSINYVAKTCPQCGQDLYIGKANKIVE